MISCSSGKAGSKASRELSGGRENKNQPDKEKKKKYTQEELDEMQRELDRMGIELLNRK